MQDTAYGQELKQTTGKAPRHLVPMILSAAALYGLCIAAPVIYRLHPAIRSFQQQSQAQRMAEDRLIAHVQDQYHHVLQRAIAIPNKDAALAYLSSELKTAAINLDGYTAHASASRANFEHWNTFWHRITGNCLFEGACLQWRHDCRLRDMARDHVQELSALAQDLRKSALPEEQMPVKEDRSTAALVR